MSLFGKNKVKNSRSRMSIDKMDVLLFIYNLLNLQYNKDVTE